MMLVLVVRHGQQTPVAQSGEPQRVKLYRS